MKLLKLFFSISLLTLVSCVQSINTYGVGDITSIPNAKYNAYFYSSGAGGKLRAVLLKSPESDVEIIPYSVQIATASGTPEEALAFMEKAGANRNIYYQGVTYKGRTIGYLLTFGYHSFARESIEINLYERGGKIYFALSEKSVD